MPPKPTIEEIVACVTSSDLDRLIALTTDHIPIVPHFPLCGEWRSNITLLHLASAYGSLTSIQYLLAHLDPNVQTDDGVFFFFFPSLDSAFVCRCEPPLTLSSISN
jgi:hypothetical protein